MPFAQKDEDAIVVEVGLGFGGAAADQILKEDDDLPRDGRLASVMLFVLRFHGPKVSHRVEGLRQTALLSTKGRSGHAPMLLKSHPRQVIRPQPAGFAGLHRKQVDLEVPMSVQVRPFRISEVDLDSECREMRVEGELDLSVVDQLQKRLDAAAMDDVEVHVCLERCDFIDSSGIAAIILAHRLLASKDRRLLLRNPSGQVSRILAITGLDDAGLISTSTDKALEFSG